MPSVLICWRGSIPYAQADYCEDRQMSRGTCNF